MGWRGAGGGRVVVLFLWRQEKLTGRRVFSIGGTDERFGAGIIASLAADVEIENSRKPSGRCYRP